MGKLPQLNLEVKRTRCLSSAHPLPKRRASGACLRGRTVTATGALSPTILETDVIRRQLELRFGRMTAAADSGPCRQLRRIG
jgi:hypothetical protein